MAMLSGSPFSSLSIYLVEKQSDLDRLPGLLAGASMADTSLALDTLRLVRNSFSFAPSSEFHRNLETASINIIIFSTKLIPLYDIYRLQ